MIIAYCRSRFISSSDLFLRLGIVLITEHADIDRLAFTESNKLWFHMYLQKGEKCDTFRFEKMRKDRMALLRKEERFSIWEA